jgi:hypothetical protein
MEILGERPVWSMSGGEMVSALDATYAEIARLETFALQLIAGLETIGHAKDVGAGTTARFLTFRYRIDAAKARRDVRLVTALPKYPAVTAALPDPAGGEDDDDGGVLLHPAQAEAIVSMLDKLPSTVPAEDLEVAERELVELGRTHGPLELRKAGVQICNRLDTDGPEPAEDKAYDRETLKLKNAENGVAFSGFLANENGELLRTLIHAHAKPRRTVDGALDPRSRDQRQADALTTVLNLSTNVVASGSVASGTARPPRADAPGGSACAASTTDASTAAAGTASRSGSKPHITVTIDFNDLKDGIATGRLTYGDPVSAGTIRRLACDAQILPIVLGSESQPLDVGTTVRLATGPMRKALIARDKGCVCCGAPPLYCDAHHVISWIDGGETKITNLVLLCKRCHRDLHSGHWDIRIINGTVHVTRPTWATPERIPRGRYRPPPTTSPTTTPGRRWPRDSDPPWITAEEAARLNPWSDPPDATPRHLQNQPSTPRTADDSDTGSAPTAQWAQPEPSDAHANANAVGLPAA